MRTLQVFVAVLSAVTICVCVHAQDGDRESLVGNVDTLRVPIRKVRLVNNNVLPEEVVARVVGDVVSQYEDGYLTSEGLQEIRFRLSRLYVEAGYVNSGVVIPDQQVENGEIYLAAVEGRLSAIKVEGNSELSDRYYRKRLRADETEILNVLQLQESLELLQQDTMVRRINAELIPGARLGDSELLLRVTENSPYLLSFGVDNHQSSSVGENRGRVSFSHQNLTGRHDGVAVNVGVTEGVEDGYVGYTLPVNSRGTALNFYYSLDDVELIEQPFDVLDIRTESRTFGFELSHSVFRNTNSNLSIGIGFYNKRSESTLLDVPFSFNIGDIRGVGESSVVPVNVEWNRRWRTQAVSVRAQARLGVDALDPTINSDAPDSEFTAFVGQFQWIKRFGARANELQLRSSFQLSADPLLAIEKFPVGGRSSVRGYRENQLVRDSGVVTSLEAHIPIARNPQAFGLANFRLVPFLDYGVAWDEDESLSTSDTAEIFSAGLGLNWDPSPYFHLEIYYGQALEEVNNPTNSLQNRGWHYAVSYSVPLGRD